KVFDWSLIPAELARRAVLSGGLNAQNVSDAIHRVRPYAVDVSSGIEVPGAKGVKDHARMAAFVRAVRAADAE
ncbi:MAG TPA: N-(5'-phosphoribosyl)anthranilate isomerase, partial [Paraburkholderia sp.]|nr:N-(5'-phosphoribosyl)anthranilate isomerase [Paraburkholderia sp.]